MTLEIDEHTIEAIASRVTAALREELEELVARLAAANGHHRPLTVEQVAERFDVARSTVYAHWREWGGYKLGDGEKAPIRFDGSALPKLRPADGDGAPQRRRPRRSLLSDNPKDERSLGKAS
jgi:transposase-like protein